MTNSGSVQIIAYAAALCAQPLRCSDHGFSAALSEIHGPAALFHSPFDKFRANGMLIHTFISDLPSVNDRRRQLPCRGMLSATLLRPA